MIITNYKYLYNVAVMALYNLKYFDICLLTVPDPMCLYAIFNTHVYHIYTYITTFGYD